MPERGKSGQRTAGNGFSLIELLIAMSILMIFSGLFFLGINASRRKDTEKYAVELSNQIRLLRTVSMSKAGEWRLALYESDGEYRCVQERMMTAEDGSHSWTAASEMVKMGHKGAVIFKGAVYEEAAGEGTGEENAPGNSSENDSGNGTLIRSWRFDRDTGACIEGDGILEVSGPGKTMEIAVYRENGRCETRAKGVK